jgi:hypothetical protein
MPPRLFDGGQNVSYTRVRRRQLVSIKRVGVDWASEISHHVRNDNLMLELWQSTG